MRLFLKGTPKSRLHNLGSIRRVSAALYGCLIEESLRLDIKRTSQRLLIICRSLERCANSKDRKG